MSSSDSSPVKQRRVGSSGRATIAELLARRRTAFLASGKQAVGEEISLRPTPAAHADDAVPPVPTAPREDAQGPSKVRRLSDTGPLVHQSMVPGTMVPPMPPATPPPPTIFNTPNGKAPVLGGSDKVPYRATPPNGPPALGARKKQKMEKAAAAAAAAAEAAAAAADPGPVGPPPGLLSPRRLLLLAGLLLLTLLAYVALLTVVRRPMAPIAVEEAEGVTIAAEKPLGGKGRRGGNQTAKKVIDVAQAMGGKTTSKVLSAKAKTRAKSVAVEANPGAEAEPLAGHASKRSLARKEQLSLRRGRRVSPSPVTHHDGLGVEMTPRPPGTTLPVVTERSAEKLAERTANGTPPGDLPNGVTPAVEGAAAAGNHDDDKDDEDESNNTWLDFMLRTWAGLTFLSLIVGPYLAWRYSAEIDELSRGEHKISKRLAYVVDYWFSSSVYARPLVLLGLTLFLIVAGGMSLFAITETAFGNAMWEAVAGVGIDWTFAGATEEGGAGVRLLAMMTSIGGMVITALLLSIMEEGLQSKMEDLKKGKSDVLESGHTVILGWSDKVLPVVKQICLASASSGDGVIVLLSEFGKAGMEDALAEYEGEFDRGKTRIICRSGNPMVIEHLRHVSVSTARVIIIIEGGTSMGQCEVDPNDLDAQLLLVLLSLLCIKEKNGLEGFIVAELADSVNKELIDMVGGVGAITRGLVDTVASHDIIGRIVLQCARQPVLSLVWEDLLGFEGAEFYFKEWPELVGSTFGSVLLSFPDAVPLGLYTAREAEILLNPPDGMLIEPGDRLIVLAEDDDSYAPTEPMAVVPMPPKLPARRLRTKAEKVLFCGWRRDMCDMIPVLDKTLRAGSTVYILSPISRTAREEMLPESLMEDLRNVTLVHVEGDPVSRKDLLKTPLLEMAAVVVMATGGAGDGADHTISSMDSRSLATLLLISDLIGRAPPPVDDGSKKPKRKKKNKKQNWVAELSAYERGEGDMRMIAEILDMRTKEVLNEAKVADFVLSNELMSKAIAMVSQERDVGAVLEELFSPAGNELYVHSAAYYAYPDEELSYADLVIRARRRNELLIGIQRLSEQPKPPKSPEDTKPGEGTDAKDKDADDPEEDTDQRPVLNPANKDEPRYWGPEDLLVVISRQADDDSDSEAEQMLAKSRRKGRVRSVRRQRPENN